jgi:bifunctional UDP-N-acetylglucosamine pyrophosphorylase/glucosamine-1-phosphate N-acetyltransferase
MALEKAMGIKSEGLGVIILAAGKGTRMKSRIAKVLHPICGSPMLEFPVELAIELEAKPIVVVVGHQAEMIKETFSTKGLIFVEQKEQLGTGHAVACAMDVFKEFDGNILILCGDVPLLKLETLKGMINHHTHTGAIITILTAFPDDPTSYGRILRNEEGRVVGIIEERDADICQKSIKEVNTGIYLAEKSFIFNSIQRLKRDNIQGEYYLTDIISFANPDKIGTFHVEDQTEAMGINTRIDLAKANEVCRMRVIHNLMLEGVTILDPRSVYIHRSVKIGRDTIIHPNCYIEGNTIIGEACIIEPGSKIVNSIIDDDVHVRISSVIIDSVVKKGAQIGPFAHIRPSSEIGEGARIGNFVEIKKSKIDKGSKASHLTYIGDSIIGKDVNIGCGTITCNYDGKKKHQTIIEDGVFVGSDTQLVAPVRIGAYSIIGAGSTITKDVPPNSLAVSRVKQCNFLQRGKKSWKEE